MNRIIFCLSLFLISLASLAQEAIGPYSPWISCWKALYQGDPGSNLVGRMPYSPVYLLSNERSEKVLLASDVKNEKNDIVRLKKELEGGGDGSLVLDHSDLELNGSGELKGLTQMVTSRQAWRLLYDPSTNFRPYPMIDPERFYATVSSFIINAIINRDPTVKIPLGGGPLDGHLQMSQHYRATSCRIGDLIEKCIETGLMEIKAEDEPLLSGIKTKIVESSEEEATSLLTKKTILAFDFLIQSFDPSTQDRRISSKLKLAIRKSIQECKQIPGLESAISQLNNYIIP